MKRISHLCLKIAAKDLSGLQFCIMEAIQSGWWSIAPWIEDTCASFIRAKKHCSQSSWI